MKYAQAGISRNRPDFFDMNTKSLRQKALNLLARRDHTRVELSRKLSQHDFTADEIQSVLDQLQHEKLLNEERFAESYVTMRSNRGYGPERIRQELRERGVSDIVADRAIEVLSHEWLKIAASVRQKKFGSIVPEEYAARAKQMQFLVYRGFTMEQAKNAC
jgi:regulatory protein